MIRWWVRLWDQREQPIVQATVRILLGLVLLYDFGQFYRLGLVLPLLGPEDAGGFSVAAMRENPPWYWEWMPHEPWAAWLLWAGLFVSAATFTAGLGTRTSAVVLLLLYAQTALILPPADRGIDRMARNMLLIFAFSSAGRTLAVDAKLRTGSWWGDGEPVPAWPRHLAILQLAVMYLTAGIYKFAYLWTPMGKFDALYVILQDPAVARADWSWLVHEPFLFLTRLATAVTIVWEWTAWWPLLVLYWEYTGSQARFPRWAVANRLHLWWLSIGVIFHLGIAITLELGIFPWAMLALYPWFLHPDELAAVGRRVGASLSRWTAGRSPGR